MRSGTTGLRVASTLQIILGVTAILFTRFLLANGDAAAANLAGTAAMLSLMLAYGGAAFQILAGIVGLLQSCKKSLLTVIFGVLLYIPQLLHFLHVKHSIGLIVLNIVLLVLPYLYLHNAYKNYKA